MVLLYESGAYRIMAKHLLLKKGATVWLYKRRIPNDVKDLYPIKGGKRPEWVIFSLKTTDKLEAAKRADEFARRQDALWQVRREGLGLDVDPKAALGRLEAAKLRPGDGRIVDSEGSTLPPVDDFITGLLGTYEPGEYRPAPSPQDQLTVDLLMGKTEVPKTLSDARAMHFALGKGPKGKRAEAPFNRAWDLLMSITGDAIITGLRREQANQFVAKLLAKGVSSETAHKYVYQIKPVIDTAIREFELQMQNPFEKVVIPDNGEGPRHERIPYTDDQLRVIQEKCRTVDDQRRWAIAMLSDTGARLAEIVGLRKADVFLEDEVPHIHLEPNEVRGIKTEAGHRDVPLVGAALWAAQRAMATEGPYLFPVFQPKQAGKDFNATTASSALVKWLRENHLATAKQGVHSFRHSLADRLRNAGISKEMREAIGGWQTKGISEVYGQGYSLRVLQEAMQKIVLPEPGN